MNDLARKDLFVCLGIWLSLEIVCFGLLPLMQLGLPAEQLQRWFLFSLLLGIGGAILMAGSTQLADFLEDRQSDPAYRFLRNRPLRSLLVSLVSWLGLLGIGFPLFVMSIQIFSKLFQLVMG
jgi:4-hydroxybenzoate polyprenyltransferase